MEAVKQTGKTSTPIAAAYAAGKTAATGLTRSTAKNITKPSSVPSFIQPKLHVNKPGDRFEQEAHTIADKVMRMLSSRDHATPLIPTRNNQQVHTFTSRHIPPAIGRLTTGRNAIENQVSRKCKSCEQEQEIQRKPANETMEKGVEVSADLKRSKGGGNPLPASVNASCQNQLGPILAE